MKKLLILLLFFTLVNATKIDKKINTTSKQIKTFDSKQNKMQKGLAKTAKAILRQKRKILRQQRKLKKLVRELKSKDEIYKNQKKSLISLKKEQHDLEQKQLLLEKSLATYLAKNISIARIIEDDRAQSVDNIIMQEVLKAIDLQTNKNIKTIRNNYKNNISNIEAVSKKTISIKLSINDIEKKKMQLIATKKESQEGLKNLQRSKKKYKKSLRRLLSQQHEMQKQLARLNIIKKDQVKKAKANAKAQQERLNRKKNTKVGKTKVKKVGSSYQKIKTVRYKGVRTISPLDKYIVTKKFGSYTDPIYGIKIFNESISMKPKLKNSKVKSVLNGKVILVAKTPLLHNIVIIEHKNSIHTIYAHIDRIAPNIKKGKRLKKGTVIGRVNNELMFEVTQKSYHINPLSMIK